MRGADARIARPHRNVTARAQPYPAQLPSRGGFSLRGRSKTLSEIYRLIASRRLLRLRVRCALLRPHLRVFLKHPPGRVRCALQRAVSRTAPDKRAALSGAVAEQSANDANRTTIRRRSPRRWLQSIDEPAFRVAAVSRFRNARKWSCGKKITHVMHFRMKTL